MIGSASGTRRKACLHSLALALAAASCQPLPHPFAADKPPALLLEVRDTAGVSIAPLAGGPGVVAKELGAAVAKALQKRDIPASDKTANLDSYQLYGRIVESPPNDGRVSVRVLWRLYDAKGKIVGQRSAEVIAVASDWQSARQGPIEQLAGASADRLLPLLVDKAIPTAPVASKPEPVRVAIGDILGAPRDGAASLRAAIAAVLQREHLTVVGEGGPASLDVAAEVAVSPVAPGMRHVKIVWHVRRPDGAEIGTATQENDVATAQLRGNWGELASSVAVAASGGLMQLVARGAPSAEGANKAIRTR